MSKVVKIIDQKKAKQALEESPDILQQYVKILKDRYSMNLNKLRQAVDEIRQLRQDVKTSDNHLSMCKMKLNKSDTKVRKLQEVLKESSL